MFCGDPLWQLARTEMIRVVLSRKLAWEQIRGDKSVHLKTAFGFHGVQHVLQSCMIAVGASTRANHAAPSRHVHRPGFPNGRIVKKPSLIIITIHNGQNWTRLLSVRSPSNGFESLTGPPQESQFPTAVAFLSPSSPGDWRRPWLFTSPRCSAVAKQWGRRNGRTGQGGRRTHQNTLVCSSQTYHLFSNSRKQSTVA